MNQIWLAGMWRGNKKVLEQSIGSISKYFNGIVAVVDSRAKIEDIDWLHSIKGKGEIIRKQWVNDHAHTSNEVLLCGKMQAYDYFVWIDETDQLKESFCQALPEILQNFQRQNIGAAYLDHPFILRYHDCLRVVCSPHWGFGNVIGNIISLSNIRGYSKDYYLTNLRSRDKESHDKSCLLNPSKYFWEYGVSNHCELLYGKYGKEKVYYHENRRQMMRIYCKLTLKIDNTLEDLERYFLEHFGKKDYDSQLIDWIEDEVSLQDFFRYKILKQDLMKDIVLNRFCWSLKRYLQTDDSVQMPPTNDGVMFKYARELNMELPK